MAVSAVPATGEAQAPAGRLRRFWDSSVGKKAVMAVTGVIGIGFVVMHMIGNLQMLALDGARQSMYNYAVLLRRLGPGLWLARGVLVAAVILHVVAAYQLTMRARAARPQDYEKRKSRVSTFASRTMRLGGVLLLLFIVFHIGDLTLGWLNPSFAHLDPYGNTRASLGRWWVALFYFFAMVALGFHLFHGAWSFVRSLGVNPRSPRPLHRSIAIAVAVITALGFAVIPLAALLGRFTDDTPLIMEGSHTAGAPVVSAPSTATSLSTAPATGEGAR